MPLVATVGVETGFQFLVTRENGCTPYTGLVDGDFTKSFFVSDTLSAVTGIVTEISNGTYRVAFTPDTVGIWLAQLNVVPTKDWVGELFQILNTGAGGQVTEAQMNTAYDDSISTLFLEVWLDRDGRSIAQAQLVSCSVSIYDVSGTFLFTETSNTPKVDGRFSLSRIASLTADRPYNAVVAVTDDKGTVTTYQAFSTVG